MDTAAAGDETIAEEAIRTMVHHSELSVAEACPFGVAVGIVLVGLEANSAVVAALLAGASFLAVDSTDRTKYDYITIIMNCGDHKH